MNVLILTPDAVGSTLLQRLITIYMQFHNFDRPVINLHELTNGLVKYYNPTFNQEVLGKKTGQWGYYQSLEEIVGLLDSVDHYKTSRLAQYHIKNRQDPLPDQISFYQYLNDNFYIISCRRHNVFEHALSWALNKVTKRLNVYTDSDKLESFFYLYRRGIEIDPNSIIQTCEAYKNYIEWTDNHFNTASYFYYEEHLPKIENYILSLPIFSTQPRCISWQENFGIDFNDWNRCHYLKSDIGTLALDYQDGFQQLEQSVHQIENKYINDVQADEQEFIQNYNNISDSSWPKINSIEDFNNLPENIKHEVTQHFKIKVPTKEVIPAFKIDSAGMLMASLPTTHQDYFKSFETQYTATSGKLQQLTDCGVLVTPPPIKKQTMSEKRHIVRNFSSCLDVYNQWISLNPHMGNPVDLDTIDQFANRERQLWQPAVSGNAKVALMSDSQDFD
jgi:hypothetical protein